MTYAEYWTEAVGDDGLPLANNDPARRTQVTVRVDTSGALEILVHDACERDCCAHRLMIGHQHALDLLELLRELVAHGALKRDGHPVEVKPEK